LNPMENVWEYLRGNKLSRLVWDGYDAIVTTCKEGWDFLIKDSDRIRSIGHRDWACANVQADWYYLSRLLTPVSTAPIAVTIGVATSIRCTTRTMCVSAFIALSTIKSLGAAANARGVSAPVM
jgi:hypothetical protein